LWRAGVPGTSERTPQVDLTMTAQRRQGRGRVSDVGRGLAALAGAAVLVVGVPAALLAAVGSPLPADVPTVREGDPRPRRRLIPTPSW
jgi:ABC-type amino acid transport system permease subunit